VITRTPTCDASSSGAPSAASIRCMAPAPGPAAFLVVASGSSVGFAGPGSGLSEEPTTGVRSAALDDVDAPECPPGPASAASWRQTTSDCRRRRQHVASVDVLPSARRRTCAYAAGSIQPTCPPEQAIRPGSLTLEAPVRRSQPAPM
jgi:hypothetical protein